MSVAHYPQELPMASGDAAAGVGLGVGGFGPRTGTAGVKASPPQAFRVVGAGRFSAPPTPRRSTRTPRLSPRRMSPRSSLTGAGRPQLVGGVELGPYEALQARRRRQAPGAEVMRIGMPPDGVQLSRNGSAYLHAAAGGGHGREGPEHGDQAAGLPDTLDPSPHHGADGMMSSGTGEIHGTEADLHAQHSFASVSGATTPTEGGEVPFHHLRGGKAQGPDSRIMKLIGGRSVLGAGMTTEPKQLRRERHQRGMTGMLQRIPAGSSAGGLLMSTRSEASIEAYEISTPVTAAIAAEAEVPDGVGKAWEFPQGSLASAASPEADGDGAEEEAAEPASDSIGAYDAAAEEAAAAAAAAEYAAADYSVGGGSHLYDLAAVGAAAAAVAAQAAEEEVLPEAPLPADAAFVHEPYEADEAALPEGAAFEPVVPEPPSPVAPELPEEGGSPSFAVDDTLGATFGDVHAQALHGESEAAGAVIWQGHPAEPHEDQAQHEPTPPPPPADPESFAAAAAAAVGYATGPAVGGWAWPGQEATLEAEAPVAALPDPGPQELSVPMPLLQNEAGSLVMPHTWRFVQPPQQPEVQPPCDYEKDSASGSQAASPSPGQRDAVADALSGASQVVNNLQIGAVSSFAKATDAAMTAAFPADTAAKRMLLGELVERLAAKVAETDRELASERRENRALRVTLEVMQRQQAVLQQQVAYLSQAAQQAWGQAGEAGVAQDAHPAALVQGTVGAVVEGQAY